MKCPRCVDVDLLEVNKYGVLVKEEKVYLWRDF